ncbi:MAG: DUF4392 domain-containing protein [Desulfobacterales bacterium]
MQTLSKRIEDIILQHDNRGMRQVRGALSPGYCYRAARMILDNRGAVLIGTGFPVSGSFETDGPIGALALYRVLTELNCEPVLVCAPPISKIFSRNYMTWELPLVDWDKSKPAVMKALKNLQPRLIVSIERPGITADGRYYNMHKTDITELTAKFDIFLQESKSPSIAFGDGGNEIGMGNVRDTLAALDIIPADTTCDELVIASVSNWGVYGVIAVLCRLLNQDLFNIFDPETIVNYLVDNGCVDGVTSRQESSEDGFPISVGISIIQQLRDLVFA